MGNAEAAVGSQAATVERLRERIKALKAAPREYLPVLRTGVKGFDALFSGGGVPVGHALELWGEAASGRTSLAMRAVAAAGREHRLAAYVDGPGELYPPAAAALGVDLRRLLIVRPKAPRQLVWSAAQLCRSGAFACVVLDLTHTGVRPSLAEGKKLLDAAFRGGTALFLLTAPEAPGDGMVRVAVSARGLAGLELEVLRSRQGGAGKKTLIPWEDLYPSQAPTYRYVDPRVAAAASEGEPGPLHAPYQRPKTHALRDGRGLFGTRPGRDTTFPRLAPSLGC